MTKWICVIDVFREFGVPVEKTLTWRAGAMVRKRFVKVYGVVPALMNRPKTSGAGSHAFAVYPPSFKREIVKIVRAVGKLAA